MTTAYEKKPTKNKPTTKHRTLKEKRTQTEDAYVEMETLFEEEESFSLWVFLYSNPA